MQRVRMTVRLSAAALLAVLSAPGMRAQQAVPKNTEAAPAKHVMIAANDIKWGPAPPGLPAGAEAAILDGDPGKPAVYTLRVKAPDGYMVPPHWHPADEHLTVLSGSLMMATGSKWDDNALHEATAGSYMKMTRRVNHFVQTKGETIFQVSAMGPFAITYVDPKEDPRKK